MSLANKFGIPESLFDASKKALEESNEYQKKVQAHMAKKGIKSLNDLTPDQKKKFFNELDAMHTAKNEEVDLVEKLLAKHGDVEVHSVSSTKEGSVISVRKNGKEIATGDYDRYGDTYWISHPSFGKGDKDFGISSDVAKHFASMKEEVESVEEELKGEMHKDAHKVLKHIKPEHHGVYKPYLKKGTYKGDYKDRAAVLSAAEKAGHIKEDTGLTQEDLDFIASLNQVDELRNVTQDQLGSRMGSSGPTFNKTPAGKAREVQRKQEHLKGQMKFTKSQGGIAGPKGKLPEEVEDFTLEDFTLEQIEEFMQTEDFNQLDELSKETLGNYIKKRSHDVATQGAITRKHAMDSEAARKDNNYTQQRRSNEKADKAFAKGWKHRQNISKAVDKIIKKA